MWLVRFTRQIRDINSNQTSIAVLGHKNCNLLLLSTDQYIKVKICEQIE